MQAKQRILVLAIASVAACGAITRQAGATDSHVYAGAACQPVNGGDEWTLVRNGSTFNARGPKDGHVRVICPIARDSVGGTNGIRAIVNVSRWALTSPANKSLLCRVATLTKSGSEFVSRTFSYSGNGTQEFVVQASPGVSAAPYAMTCDLAYYSSINSYYIEEL